MAKLKALVKAGVMNLEGFYTVGGRTAIDFVNTGAKSDGGDDKLATFENLLSFLKSSQLLHEDEASTYHMYLFQNPQRCEAVMESLRALRKELAQALSQIASGWPMDPMLISSVNDRLALFQTRLQLVPSEAGLELASVLVEDGPEQLIYPILKDIAEFLASDETDKVRLCAAEDCELYFINNSRNGRRRWCSMSTCGNRAKVNAYLKRQES